MSLPRYPAPPPGYRPGVGVMLINRQGQVFVASRRDAAPDAWQMPQGGIDSGEDPRQAAFRELEEEIGTANAEIVAEAEGWLTYDLPPALAGRVWSGRYRGQAQKWFAALFRGNDSEIDLGKHTHPEFAAWKWVPLEALPTIIVGFKRPLYAELVAELGPKVKAAAQRAPARNSSRHSG